MRDRLLCTKDIFALLLSVTQLGFHSDLYRAMKMVTLSISSWWKKWSKRLMCMRKSLKVWRYTCFHINILWGGVGFSTLVIKLLYIQTVTHDVGLNMQKSVNDLGPLFYYSGGVGVGRKPHLLLNDWTTTTKLFFCTQS